MSLRGNCSNSSRRVHYLSGPCPLSSWLSIRCRAHRGSRLKRPHLSRAESSALRKKRLRWEELVDSFTNHPNPNKAAQTFACLTTPTLSISKVNLRHQLFQLSSRISQHLQSKTTSARPRIFVPRLTNHPSIEHPATADTTQEIPQLAR